MKKILLIIPAYNEEENILKTCSEIMEYNKKNKVKYDILVVNDGSKDNTEKILVENNINHIKLVQNLGIGGAVQTGYKYALENDYDIAVQFDGDGQHDVSCVQKILDPILSGEVNMSIGSRFIDKTSSDFKSSWLRRLGINIISYFIKTKTGTKIYDTTSGFRAIDKSIILLFASEYPVEYPEPISTVNALLKKYKVKEIPVRMKARENGVSSISSWKSAYYMINVIMSIMLLKRVK